MQSLPRFVGELWTPFVYWIKYDTITESNVTKSHRTDRHSKYVIPHTWMWPAHLGDWPVSVVEQDTCISLLSTIYLWHRTTLCIPGEDGRIIANGIATIWFDYLWTSVVDHIHSSFMEVLKRNPCEWVLRHWSSRSQFPLGNPRGR